MPVVASFGDTVLYDSDIAILESPEYLTDNIISLFTEILNEECEGVYCIPPSVVQLMKLTDAPNLEDMFAGLELERYDIILCPVNDSRSATSTLSGQHWSLLCYVRKQATVFHIDSLNAFNAAETKLMCSKLSKLLDKRLVSKNLCCAQQKNGYDCGVYAIFFAKSIVECFKSSGTFEAKCVQNALPNSYRKVLISEISSLPK